MANIPIVKGSSFLFQGSVNGLAGNKLSDSGVTAKIEFYNKGKYSSTKVTVEKTSMVINTEDTDANEFSCYVNTSTLDEGALAAALTVVYPSPANDGETITEIIPVLFSATPIITVLS